MKTFNTQILTPEKTLFKGDIVSLTVPTKEGQITIMPNHITIVTLLSIGEIILSKENGDKENFLIQGGVLEVKQTGEVVILADREIDLEKDSATSSEEAKERAREAMENKDDVLSIVEGDNLERALFINKRKGRNS
jgi:F-type H+-transporting ATPase subunit epsilon